MEQFVLILPTLLLVFMRISAFFVVAPLFSYRTIPNVQRLILALILAVLLVGSIQTAEPIPLDGTYFLLIMKEVVVGLAIGIVAFIVMSAIQIAGGFIDFQMGFAIANVIDPQTGAQSPLLGQFFNAVALLLLMTLNGHHLLLDGIFYSYEFIGLTQIGLAFGEENFAVFITKTFAQVFLISFQMAVPIVATLFLVDLALGITARTVPQLNIFVVGFPIKITVSFLVLVVMVPVMVALIRRLFEFMAYSMRDLMLILGGG